MFLQPTTTLTPRLELHLNSCSLLLSLLCSGAFLLPVAVWLSERDSERYCTSDTVWRYTAEDFQGQSPLSKVHARIIITIYSYIKRCLFFFLLKPKTFYVLFIYVLPPSMCVMSLFFLLEYLYPFLRCSVSYSLTTALKSSPHKRSKCYHTFIKPSCLWQLKLFFLFCYQVIHSVWSF